MDAVIKVLAAIGFGTLAVLFIIVLRAVVRDRSEQRAIRDELVRMKEEPDQW